MANVDVYYAVRKGRKPGVYTDWKEVQRQVIGFKGAIFKKFKTKEEAEEFVHTEDEDNQYDPENLPEIYAFSDGSFNEETNVYGCGGFIIDKREEEKKYIIQGHNNDEEMATMRNISGELLGSRMIIEKAISLEIPEITIFYDCYGVRMWATGEWDRTKDGTKAYYEFIQSIKDKIILHFIHVEAHHGIPGNEEADNLAKQAVGLRD